MHSDDVLQRMDTNTKFISQQNLDKRLNVSISNADGMSR